MDSDSQKSQSEGRGVGEASPSSLSAWRPSHAIFSPYSPPQKSDGSLRVIVRRPLVARFTKDILETYQLCNPQFKYSQDLNPKRYLSTPSVGVLNDGCDNANSDLILTVNYVLINFDTQRRYIVKDVLGHGTFGQVAKCWIPDTSAFVAVKIIKNQPAYYQQALVEVSILTTLNKKYDPDDKHHVVRIYDYFVYQRHLCICFELLDTNLYELIKMNHFRGLSLNIVQLFSKQILCGLALLKDAGIIHCDLKPENILLCRSIKPAEVKIIDFGSACMEERTVYSYIQSRYYRSPEVLLGYHQSATRGGDDHFADLVIRASLAFIKGKMILVSCQCYLKEAWAIKIYTIAIDMWSFGCIVAELFLGLPLFPGASEFDLLKRMIEILGGQPPDYLLKEAKNTSKFFKCIGSIHNIESEKVSTNSRSAYQALSADEYEARELKNPSIGKEYFNHMHLEAIVTNYPYRKNLEEKDIIKERQIRLALVDFLRGLVEFDPAKRWSPFQASKHPFVTGEPFTCPYKPVPETPRLPVAQNIRVDHHPGGGHWFAAGLSPNIPGRNRVVQNSSHYEVVPYAHGGSYGSIGSHGSYNDGTGLGSSCGSYGDTNSMFAYYSPVGPSGLNMHAPGNMSVLGSSPDARRIVPYPHGNGVGNFTPLPLGTSPSQFTPPSSYGQVATGSPGHYGPTSPARGSCHGSPLGKMAAGSQYNRRKSLGYSQSQSQPQSQPRSQESSSSSSWQGQYTDGTGFIQPDGNSQLLGNAARWKQHGGFGGGYYAIQHKPGFFSLGSTMQFTHDKNESGPTLPDPGDWDPNYSDELLLQEDGSELSCMVGEFSKGVNLGSPESLVGHGRFNHVPSTSSSMSFQRQNGPLHVSSNEAHGGYSRSTSNPSHLMPPHTSHTSPRRLGQRLSHGRPIAPVRGNDWNHHGNGMAWGLGPGTGPGPGRRANHSISSIPPPSPRGRKDYGRIS